MSLKFICDHCGKEFPEEELNTVGEDLLCNDCIADNTIVWGSAKQHSTAWCKKKAHNILPRNTMCLL